MHFQAHHLPTRIQLSTAIGGGAVKQCCILEVVLVAPSLGTWLVSRHRQPSLAFGSAPNPAPQQNQRQHAPTSSIPRLNASTRS